MAMFTQMDLLQYIVAEQDLQWKELRRDIVVLTVVDGMKLNLHAVSIPLQEYVNKA